MPPTNPSGGEIVFTTTDAPIGADSRPPTPDPRVLARDAIARFLGTPTGNAQTAVAELTDVEAAEVADAAADRHTARAQIKGVLSRAYDRRRVAAQREAGDKGEFLRRRGLAQAVLERSLHMSVADAADVAHKLSEGDQQRLADLSGREEDVADEARAILEQAEDAAGRAEDPTDVIPETTAPEIVAAHAATDAPSDAPPAD